jgi:hypothetical protein
VCGNYALARQKMLDDILRETGIQVTRNNILNIAIHGKTELAYQAKIYKIITTYLLDSKRFI